MENEQAAPGLTDLLRNLMERISFLEGQIHAHHLVIAHLANGVSAEALANATTAGQLLIAKCSHHHEAYLRGVKAGVLRG